mmetsp:Transcript_2875/g.4132  ORF Transcript_2875/g.4132 Transcript_2875/m.4132 type:complete len:277 (-) Transcript_2875:122-952(-)
MQLRLSSFRKWLSEDAGVRVHQNLTIVADDELSTTKTGVVDLDDISNRQQPQSLTLMDSENTIDVIELPDDCDRSLYDGTTMGCQVRGTDDINKAEILMEMPRSAMITPDLVASSDAGRAVLACMEPVSESHQSDFWMTFENTTFLQNQMEEHLDMNDGKQLIQQIIGMRSQAEEESERKTASEGEKAKIEKRCWRKCKNTRKLLLQYEAPLKSFRRISHSRTYLTRDTVASLLHGERAANFCSSLSSPRVIESLTVERCCFQELLLVIDRRTSEQ